MGIHLNAVQYHLQFKNFVTFGLVLQLEQEALKPIESAMDSGITALLEGHSFKRGAEQGFFNGIHTVSADIEHMALTSVVNALAAPGGSAGRSMTNAQLIKSAKQVNTELTL
jgi:hypothetical protein